jgi:hypothetical protein
MNILTADLRCLDVHAHLGDLVFDHNPDMAIRYYDVGVKIGEFSLGKDFSGLLPWGWTNNRPSSGVSTVTVSAVALREVQGRREGFTRMLWLNLRQPRRALQSPRREGGNGLA